MPVGQTVNYSKLTRIIPARILIVEGTAHVNKTEDIKNQIKRAIQVLNPQRVAILFDYSVEIIKQRTTTDESLLDIEIGVDDTPDDESYNESLMGRIGDAVISETEQPIPLLDFSGETFIQIYTDKIKRHTPKINDNELNGFALYKIPTMILTESMYTLDTTLAHEICHNLGLWDIYDQNQKNNLMWGYNDRTGHNPELDQVNSIQNKLDRYPERYSRNQAPVPDSP